MWKNRGAWACAGVMVVVLITYAHITIPIKFMKEYEVLPSQRRFDSDSNLTLRPTNKEVFHSNTKSYGPIALAQLNVPWWEGECPCSKKKNCEPELRHLATSSELQSRPLAMSSSFRHSNITGTCSLRAAADGNGQRVVSFSLYGDDPEYWIGMSQTLVEVKTMYPGWKVWLYTDPRNRSDVLCPLLREHAHLRICDVTNLPHPLNNVAHVHPMLWRISPLGDPAVGFMILRDTDSRFTQREQMAIHEWMASDKVFHIMRDHPEHNVPIMGGMWGAKWKTSTHSNASITRSSSPHSLSAKDLRIIRNRLLVAGYKQSAYGFDQIILQRMLWPVMRGSVMSHDSFYCKVYPDGWRPWPVERSNGTFVGSPAYRKEFAEDVVGVRCPLACRPQDHRDWIYC